jgi:DNA-directed RNA polymerase subunit H (RpoH/RPB5)
MEDFQEELSRVRNREITLKEEPNDLQGTREIERVVKEIESSSEDLVYVVNDISSFTKIFSLLKERYYCKVFSIDEAYKRPLSHHTLVPKHEAAEARDIPDKNLPRILHSDIVCRWHGWRCLTIVKITREGGNVHYRHLYCDAQCPICDF